MQRGKLSFLLPVLFFCNISAAAELTDAEAMALGYRVAAINDALLNPGAPGAMQAVTDLGHDQRYYVMVRGWLMYHLQGDLSILAAGQAREQEVIRTRAGFLQQAIRAIDLE